jgi:hypothetical protein
MSSEKVIQSVHQRLLNVRDESGEQFNHLLIRYGLERLLYRLVAAGHGDTFVLKGAMLLALWQDVPGRPTRDIDLLGFGTVSHDRLRDVFASVCNADVIDDGLRFDPESIQTDDIRDDQEYHGIRLRLAGFLGKARIAIQIDVGFGDAVTPPPESIEYPAILDFPSPQLRAYHPATAVAEKLNALVELGIMNSRMKDFYDMHLILTHMDIEEEILRAAIRETFRRRKSEIPQEMPIAFTPEFWLEESKGLQWNAFLRRSLLSDFGLGLAEVLTDLRDRLWPVLESLRNECS